MISKPSLIFKLYIYSIRFKILGSTCKFVSLIDEPSALSLSKMAEGLQKRLQQELEKYKVAQKDYQKVLAIRQQLDGQLLENKVVNEELSLLESGANVFKLMGPVLVKQELEEAKQNVEKRLEYITNEIKRHDSHLQELEKKQDSHRESLGKLQQQFQQAQIKAAMQA